LARPLLLAPWSLLGSYIKWEIALGINSVLPLTAAFAIRGASDANLSRARHPGRERGWWAVGSFDRRLVRYPGMGRARAKASPRQVDLRHSLGGCLDRREHLLLSKIFYRFGSVLSAWLWRSKFRRSTVFDIPCFS
jgi:hypothetical protein